MDTIQIMTLAALAGRWQADADAALRNAHDALQNTHERSRLHERSEVLSECADVLRGLCETRFEDCPHAAPHRYCAECPVSPCPIGLGKPA